MAAGQYGEMQRKSIAINRTVGKDWKRHSNGKAEYASRRAAKKRHCTVGKVERSSEMALQSIDGKAVKRKRKE